ncbi:MAG: hypothetical protein AVDCRST_MAG85-2538 [uncultured Solirubrobacteraceae bacterium]|uniref:ER-bound oxygenase mpaB/mpaB'/Rubber oxygenase catalytic domain-containing protein n=1 Tax=uncultured Solirubrobacteraceae bacterium TaxID=1162706 RepID=A0A6J4T6V2_9ACTN|nr:MAG: hypothetical protein AVDCRST_MAG85-2538 [uncultured Solirubrobacteraceae bacterium]
MTPETYFTEDSMLYRVHREYAVALSGPRALLLQATHPIAFEGFFAHTSALDDPYGRLNRTAAVMDAILFGPRDRADRLTKRVRAMHRKVTWEIDGTTWRADDPDLLLWVLATLVDSALLVYQRYVGPLTRDERDAYWQDYKVVGHHFALTDDDLPDTIEDFEAYMASMLAGDFLGLSDDARDLAIDIVMSPPVPLAARPLLELANQITVGLLPEKVRKMYGFSWDPARGLAVRAGAEYTKRLVVPLLPGFIRHVPSARAAA